MVSEEVSDPQSKRTLSINSVNERNNSESESESERKQRKKTKKKTNPVITIESSTTESSRKT